MLHNGSLIINAVDAEDAAVYKCVGYTNDGPVQTFAVQLVLACKITSANDTLFIARELVVRALRAFHKADKHNALIDICFRRNMYTVIHKIGTPLYFCNNC